MLSVIQFRKSTQKTLASAEALLTLLPRLAHAESRRNSTIPRRRAAERGRPCNFVQPGDHDGNP
jgi:hypothetical protein